MVAGLVLLAGPPLSAQATTVLVADVDGAITPVVADYLTAAVEQAAQDGHEALVVQIDTPGGLDTSMREIVQGFIASDVPVIVYVSPQGARAASAGAIIAFSGHVAAMAPATAMGASTPVDLEGGDVERKVINDAAAFAESIARLRGRNVEFARETVLEGRSAAADEALEIGAVDLIAANLPALLEDLDGREVLVGPEERPVFLATAGAVPVEYELQFFQRIQQLLADPNLAFIFLSLGTLAIIYEVVNPGIGAGGVLGAVLLILAMFSLSVLPVTAAGLLLLAVAIAMFAAELFAPGIGIAAAGGTIALLLSGIFLFRDTPGVRVSLSVMVPVALVVGGGVVFAGRLVVRSQKGPSRITGEEQYVGRVVTPRKVDGHRGQALVNGSWWNIRSKGDPLLEGVEVRVTGYEGLELQVEPVGSQDQQAGDES